jgi:ribosome-binding ATPase YchF (GTP1/OBG family)
VRCYEDELITHVEKTIDPIRDIDIIELELMMSDVDMLQKIKGHKVKGNDFASQQRSELIDRALAGTKDFFTTA